MDHLIAFYFIGAYLTTHAALALVLKYPSEEPMTEHFRKASIFNLWFFPAVLFLAWPVVAVIVVGHILHRAFKRPVE